MQLEDYTPHITCPIQVGKKIVSNKDGIGGNPQTGHNEFKYFVGSTATIIKIQTTLDPDEHMVSILFDSDTITIIGTNKPIMVHYNLGNLKKFFEDFSTAKK